MYCFYRVTQEPVEFNNISTRGIEITLKASILAGIVNLKRIGYYAFVKVSVKKDINNVI